MSNLKFVEITKVASKLYQELERRRNYFLHMYQYGEETHGAFVAISPDAKRPDSLDFLKQGDFPDKLLYEMVDHQRIDNQKFNYLSAAITASCVRALLKELTVYGSVPFRTLMTRAERFYTSLMEISAHLRSEECARYEKELSCYLTDKGALATTMLNLFTCFGEVKENGKPEIINRTILLDILKPLFVIYRGYNEEEMKDFNITKRPYYLSFLEKSIKTETVVNPDVVEATKEQLEVTFLEYLKIITTSVERVTALIRSRYLYVPETFLK